MNAEKALQYIEKTIILEQPENIGDVGPESWDDKISIIESDIIADDSIDKKILKEEERLIEMTKDIPKKLTKEIVEAFLKIDIINEQKKNATWKKSTLTMSDFSDCIRKAYYAFKNTPQKQTFIYPYNKIATDIGDTCHNRIQKVIKNIGCELKINDIIINGFNISGRLDLSLNENTLVEIKTIDVIPTKPLAKHVKQVAIYAYLLNTYYNKNITCLQLLYIARGKITSEVFDLELTPETINKIGDMVNEYTSILRKHLELNVPPTMDNKYSDTNSCIFCPYEYVCKKTGKYESVKK